MARRSRRRAMWSERVLVSLRNTPVAREPGVFPLSLLLHALPYKTEVGGRGRKDYFPCFVASAQERRQKNKRLGQTWAINCIVRWVTPCSHHDSGGWLSASLCVHLIYVSRTRLFLSKADTSFLLLKYICKNYVWFASLRSTFLSVDNYIFVQ